MLPLLRYSTVSYVNFRTLLDVENHSVRLMIIKCNKIYNDGIMNDERGQQNKYDFCVATLKYTTVCFYIFNHLINGSRDHRGFRSRAGCIQHHNRISP